MSTALLTVLAAHVQAVAGRSREAIDTGPFRAFFSRTSDDPLLSLAVPRKSAADWRPGIDSHQGSVCTGIILTVFIEFNPVTPVSS